MSDELNLNAETIPTADIVEDQEYEEICSEEVDRVVESLDELIESVQSENIQAYLEEASNNIFTLVYDESDLDEIQDEAA